MFLLDLFEIFPLLSKQYFSYFVKTVALAQPFEKDIAEKWDPGPKTSWWGPKVEPWAGALRKNPGLGPSSGTVGWDPKMNDKVNV